MENKLATRWRTNVSALLEHFRLNKSQMARMIGKSSSTIQANFGGTPTDRNYPSGQTIALIENAFGLKKGVLSNEGFDPVKDAGLEPPVIQEPPRQLATINIPISDDKLARIMRILNE